MFPLPFSFQISSTPLHFFLLLNLFPSHIDISPMISPHFPNMLSQTFLLPRPPYMPTSSASITPPSGWPLQKSTSFSAPCYADRHARISNGGLVAPLSTLPSLHVLVQSPSSIMNRGVIACENSYLHLQLHM